jgi:cytochrome bd ubiquinol oxidase subunit II
VMKTSGDLQARARRHAMAAGVATLGLIGVVSLWTALLIPVYYYKWFAWPSMLYSGAVPLLVLACAWLMYRGLQTGKDRQPFLAALGLFVLCFAGLGISFYPHIVPPSLTIWEAAAPDKSLAFLLTGAAVLVPIILIYTGYAYWVFRGKVDPEEGYH